MKKFTCSEMGGPCDEVIEGETVEQVVARGMAHLSETKDEPHTQLNAMMETSGSEDTKREWMSWFKGEWDRKESS